MSDIKKIHLHENESVKNTIDKFMESYKDMDVKKIVIITEDKDYYIDRFSSDMRRLELIGLLHFGILTIYDD